MDRDVGDIITYEEQSASYEDEKIYRYPILYLLNHEDRITPYMCTEVDYEWRDRYTKPKVLEYILHQELDYNFGIYLFLLNADVW